MSINITVKSDLDVLAKRLQKMGQERQMKFIAALAITDVAYKARDAVRNSIIKQFSRPVPLTQRSHFAEFAGKGKRATKDQLWAKVGVISEVSKGTPPARYLEAEIVGGVRKLKPYERVLQRAGLLAPGWFTVPGKGIKLDSYGNIRAAQIVQMLSYLRANADVGVTSNRSMTGKGAKAKPKQFFVVFPGSKISGARKLPPGIYQRLPGGKGFRSFVMFVRAAPRYRMRLDVRRIVARAVSFWFPFAIDKAVRQAMRTNKR